MMQTVRIAGQWYICKATMAAGLLALAGGLNAEVVEVTERSLPGGILSRSTVVYTQTEHLTTNAPVEHAGYRFTHWTINGARHDDFAGRAKNPVRFEVLETIDAVAHYLPTDEDTDEDGVPDWFEIHFYGDLNQGAESDTDGDGLTLAQEYRYDYHPAMSNSYVSGGVSMRNSESVTILVNPELFFYTERSDPGGLVSRSLIFSNGTEVTSQSLGSNIQEYAFAYWELDGERQTNALGGSLSRFSFIITNHAEAVAKYYPLDQDTDENGIPDWWAYRYFGELIADPDADVSGDGLSIADAYRYDYNPLLSNTLVHGGVSMRNSELIWVDIAGHFEWSFNSDPSGLITAQSGLSVSGTVITTPAIDSAVDDYRFACWYINGAPRTDDMGQALSRPSFVLNTNTAAVAKYYPVDQDTNENGIPDWWAYRYFGELIADPNADVSGDGLSIADAYRYDYNPLLSNSYVSGGVSMRNSESLLLILRHAAASLETSPASRDHGYTATNSQAINVSANTNWTATPNELWITIESGAAGSGTGTVTYGITANEETSPRSGSITIEGGGLTRTFTVNQESAPMPPELSAPTGVSASDGTYTDKVHVSWNAVDEATSYELWRHTSNNSDSAERIASGLTSTTQDDTNAVAGALCYYWVKSKNAIQTSAFSASDSGWRLLQHTLTYTAGENGSISGTATQIVDRGSSGSEVTAVPNDGCNFVKWSDDSTLNPRADTNVTADIAVTAEFALSVPAAPTGVTASEGTFSDKIRISWNEVAFADSYQVWRHMANNSSGANRIASGLTGTSYDDTDASAGMTYYYWIKAVNAAGTSDFSESAAGRRKTLQSDFSGDGQSDVVVFDTATGTWYVQSEDGLLSSMQLGVAGCIPVPADFDGDGISDLAVYDESSGYWYILKSSDSSLSSAKWGDTGYAPVPADYDGDGKADLTVYCESGDWPGYWYILKSTDLSMSSAKWGDTGYTPVPADYDGDGIADLAVYCASGDWPGYWYILKSTDYTMSYAKWGDMGYTPVPADYDGDGIADLAVYCESGDWPGYWYILKSTDYTMSYMQLGAVGYTPVPGDYDGDGLTDIAVYHEESGWWWMLLSGSGYALSYQQFGGPGYVPVM